MAYATEADMINLFGRTNIRTWADLENRDNQVDIDARVAWALSTAEDWVNDRLRYGPYEIPFTEPVVSAIRDLTARQAGVLLYSTRGIADTDAGQKPLLVEHKKYIEMTVRDIMKKKLRLDLTSKKCYPAVSEIEDDNNE